MRRVKDVATGLLRSGAFWFFLLSLPAVLPLLREGYFVSHDGLFHLHRLAGLDRALQGGILYPRWFPEFAYGYGHPVLNFYSPLAYYLGEVFHLWGAGFILSTKLAFLAGLLLSGLAFYLWTRDLWGQFPALVGAVAYLYAPYHLADTYIRGALAESLAFVFMPLILWVIERFFAREERGYLVVGALAYGGLILTHNLTSLIFTPFALAYAILLARRRWKTLAIWALSFLLALALTAFYWLPALTEARWVGLAAGLGSTGYRRHLAPLLSSISPFLLYRYFPHQGVTAEHPLGLIQALVIIGSFPITLHLAKAGRRGEAWRMAFFLALAIASFFMTLTYSLPLWKAVEPILTPLQYPWRFMALTSLGVACLAGGTIYGVQVTRRLLGYALGSAFLLLFPLSGLGRLPLESLPLTEGEVNVVGMWEGDFAHRQIGTTWTAEYLPVWVRADRSEIALPPSHPLSPEEAISDDDRVVLIEERYLSYRLQVKGDGMRLRLHTFYFPGWQGYIDGTKVGTYPSGDFGLVTLDVPQGEHRVDLRFEDTWEQKLGSALSLATLILLILALLRYGRRKHIFFAFSVVLLLGGLLAWHLRPFDFATQPVELEANLEGKLRLLGYSLDKSVYQQGDVVKVTLYWLSLQAMEEDYMAFVHLMDEGETKMWAQHDDDPVGGFTPTTRWRPGELIVDRHELLLPEGTPPGSYKIFTGMYEYETVRNLTILEGGRPDNRLLLGTIEVR